MSADSPVFYNENDAYAAQWLRNLADAGHLSAGPIDERSILDLDAQDLRPFRQCHFFAGIGGWPYALALAGWPDDREVWTGSCPCQPLSSAGQRKGHADERHLWPAFYDLIAECRPATVFGEQVASKDGREWLAGVRADLEHLGYAVGAADLSAAGVGAPHIRQRLFWVADRTGSRRNAEGRASKTFPQPGAIERPDGRGDAGGLADASEPGREGRLSRRADEAREDQHRHAGRDGAASGLADSRHDDRPARPAWRLDEPGASVSQGLGGDGEDSSGLDDAAGARRFGPQPEPEGQARDEARLRGTGEPSPWSGAVWLPCLDGKARRTQSSIFPLADGVSARVGRLRAYGNAIVPQAAVAFVKAFLDIT